MALMTREPVLYTLAIHQHSKYILVKLPFEDANSARAVIFLIFTRSKSKLRACHRP